MPPESCVRQLALVLQSTIDYMLTAGDHAAITPNFMSYGCFKNRQDGLVEYDLGPEAKSSTIDQLYDELVTDRIKPKTPQKKPTSTKRTHENTPQKGARRKKNLFNNTSTPKP